MALSSAVRTFGSFPCFCKGFKFVSARCRCNGRPPRRGELCDGQAFKPARWKRALPGIIRAAAADLKHFVFFVRHREAWLIVGRLFAEVIGRMDERSHVIV